MERILCLEQLERKVCTGQMANFYRNMFQPQNYRKTPLILSLEVTYQVSFGFFLDKK